MKKIRLKFKVAPEWLDKKTFVKNPVRCVIIDSEAIFLTDILGESGRKMVTAGFPFIFEKVLADRLISKGIAKKVK